MAVVDRTAVPFGVTPDGRVRTVNEVPRGLACGLECYECGGRLVARQGSVLDWHLAHYAGEEGGCAEGAVHKLLKMAVAKTAELRGHPLRLPGWGWVKLREAIAEREIKELRLRPDVTARFRHNRNDCWHVFEVAVSNPKTDTHCRAYAGKGIHAWELHASGFAASTDPEAAALHFVTDQEWQPLWRRCDTCGTVEIRPNRAPQGGWMCSPCWVRR